MTKRPSTRPIVTWLTHEYIDHLDAECLRRNCTRQQVVCEALSAYFDKRTTQTRIKSQSPKP